MPTTTIATRTYDAVQQKKTRFLFQVAMKVNEFEQIAERCSSMSSHEAEMYIDLQVRKTEEQIQRGDSSSETKQCWRLFKQLLREIQAQIGQHTQTHMLIEKSMINGETIRWIAHIGINSYQRMLTRQIWLNEKPIENKDAKHEIIDLLKQYIRAEKNGSMFEMLEVANEVKLKSQTI